MSELVHELVYHSASRCPEANALAFKGSALNYAQLAENIRLLACNYAALGLERFGRIAVYLDKRMETVVSLFAAPAAGGVMVPVNPLLKAEQVGHILRDSNTRMLVTSADRLRALAPVLTGCTDLRIVIVAGANHDLPDLPGIHILPWDEACKPSDFTTHRAIDTDMAAILYT